MYEELIAEVNFKTSRSSGPGGQHVNKVESRVELIFDVINSDFLEISQKKLVIRKLKNRISNEGLLRLQSDETRSQAKNKELVVQRFLELITVTLMPEKERKPTKPKRSAREKRLRNKKKQAEKKTFRKPLSDQPD